MLYLGHGSKIALVRSYLRVLQAAGQVKILIFLVKIKFFPIYANIFFVMQGKCLFEDISRPELGYLGTDNRPLTLSLYKL